MLLPFLLIIADLAILPLDNQTRVISVKRQLDDRYAKGTKHWWWMIHWDYLKTNI